MNKDAALLNKIFEITHGALDSATFSFPQLSLIMQGMSATRVTRQSRYWKKNSKEDRSLVVQNTEDLIAGFYTQTCPWFYFIKGSPMGIECWFGISRRGRDTLSLNSALRGVFPDVRFGKSAGIDLTATDRLRHASVLSGIPSPKPEEQIEKICRGLYGTYWGYFVYATPISASEIMQIINDTATQIHETYANYLLKSSAIDEQNRLAKRYIELLEAKLKRFEQGRAVGMWNVQCVLMSENSETMGRARGLLHSAYAGEKSFPVPLRVCSCSETSSLKPGIEPLHSGEVAIISCPPIEDYPGYEIVEYARFGVEPVETVHKNSGAVIIGEIIDRGANTGNMLRIPAADLTKHALIVGGTGSGKTNTCFSVIVQPLF
ncbi:MAG: hypothetical protein V1762_03550 [Nitrospirota bacterium]